MPEIRYQLNLSSSLAALIKGLHPHLKQKIRKALGILSIEPRTGKLLKDELAGLRSYRVGGMRIIYRIDEERAITVILLGPRKTIYLETLRLIKQDRT